MIKAILFDMDGTLTDSEKYYVEGTFRWVNNYKKVPIEKIYSIVGLDMDGTYNFLSNLLDISYDKAKGLNTSYFKDNPINYNDYLFSDVKDTLKILKGRGYKLTLCTVSDRYMLDNFLKQCNYENYFDCLLSSDDIKESKPSPEIYLKTLEYLNLKNDEAIVIEDSYNGILSGKSAGIKVCARDSSRYHVDQSMADYIFRDMHEILDLKMLL